MRAVVISGPTGVGKSQISFNLAKKLRSPIIIADAVQIYKYFDIGANKPAEGMQGRVDYLMMNRYNPGDIVNARNYAIEAFELMQKAWKQGKTPIIEGGSHLYLKLLLFSNHERGVEVPSEIIQKAKELITPTYGDWDACIEVANAKFPDWDIELQKNDYYRLEKAISLKLAGAVPLELTHNPDFDVRCFFFDMESRSLFRSLDFRCEKLIEDGLVEEVVKLLKDGHLDFNDLKRPPSHAIGYSETVEYVKQLMEAINAKDRNLNEIAVNLFFNYIKQFQLNTRKFVKSQRKNFNTKPFQFIRSNINIDSFGQLPQDKILKSMMHLINCPRETYLERLNLHNSNPSVEPENITLEYKSFNFYYTLHFDGVKYVPSTRTKDTSKRHLQIVKTLIS